MSWGRERTPAEIETALAVNPNYDPTKRVLLERLVTAGGLAVVTAALSARGANAYEPIGFQDGTSVIPQENKSIFSYDIRGERLIIDDDVIRKTEELATRLHLKNRGISFEVRKPDSECFYYASHFGQKMNQRAYVEGYGNTKQKIVIANRTDFSLEDAAHEIGHTVYPSKNPNVFRFLLPYASQIDTAYNAQYNSAQEQIRPLIGVRPWFPHYSKYEMDIFEYAMGKIGSYLWPSFISQNSTRLELEDLKDADVNEANKTILGAAAHWVNLEFSRLNKNRQRNQAPYLDDVHFGMFMSMAVSRDQLKKLVDYSKLKPATIQWMNDYNKAYKVNYACEGFATLFSDVLVQPKIASKIYPGELLDSANTLIKLLENNNN